MNKTAIIKKVAFWQEKLGLVNWDIGVKFENTGYPRANDIFTGLAKTHCQSTYKLATITFDPKLLRLVDDKTIIHEILHCLFSDMVGFARANIDNKKHDKAENWSEHFEEQLVSELERIIHRMYKK